MQGLAATAAFLQQPLSAGGPWLAGLYLAGKHMACSPAFAHAARDVAAALAVAADAAAAAVLAAAPAAAAVLNIFCGSTGPCGCASAPI